MKALRDGLCIIWNNLYIYVRHIINTASETISFGPRHYFNNGLISCTYISITFVTNLSSFYACLEAHMFVNWCFQQWRLINLNTVQDLQKNIFSPFWKSIDRWHLISRGYWTIKEVNFLDHQNNVYHTRDKKFPL